MTNWEIRTSIVFWIMKLLRIKFADMRDSYMYNPYSCKEIEEWIQSRQGDITEIVEDLTKTKDNN